jgi:sulfur-carrier protein
MQGSMWFPASRRSGPPPGRRSGARRSAGPSVRWPPVARLRLFASAREAAGTGRDVVDGSTVADVLSASIERYGAAFAAVLPTCRVWVNGEPAEPDVAVGEADEVALLPPVSGG